MPIETVLVKRRPLHSKEVGFFPSNPVSEEDVSLVSTGSEVMCEITSPRHLVHLKFIWALAQKVAENTDFFLDKDDAMEALKERVGHTKVVVDPDTGELVTRVRSLKKISDEEIVLVRRRMVNVVCMELIPGMEPGVITEEIERMVGAR